MSKIWEGRLTLKRAEEYIERVGPLELLLNLDFPEKGRVVEDYRKLFDLAYEERRRWALEKLTELGVIE